MLVHVVLLRFTEETPSAHVDRVVEAIRSLPAAIPEIRSYTVSRDAGIDEANSDVSIIAEFDDEDSYRRYSVDPSHRKVIEELILPHLSKRSAIQYFV